MVVGFPQGFQEGGSDGINIDGDASWDKMHGEGDIGSA